MVFFPGAEVRLLGEQTQGPMTGHDIVCLHTMAGYLVSTDQWFRIGNGAGFRGTESHYGVGGKWGPDLGGDLDGKVWAWQDRMHTADANLEGRSRVISIETADNAKRPIQPWTPRQVEAIARILAWESSLAAHADCPTDWTCHRQGIPLELIPDTRWGRRGIGYHRQGVDPWRVDGGLRWSTSYGKDCPTFERIRQIPDVLARARAIANNPHLEDDMFTDEDRRMLRKLVDDNDKVQHPVLGRLERRTIKLVNSIGSGDVDAAEVARLVLAQLTPEQIAAAITDALPAELGDQVVDALHRRTGTPSA